MTHERLKLVETFGLDKRLGAVQAISRRNPTSTEFLEPLKDDDEEPNLLVFTAGKNVVQYDFGNGSQRFYQAEHSNKISAIITSADHSLVVTGDSGKQEKSKICICDAITIEAPKWQIQLPEGQGVQALALDSSNSRLAAVVNTSEDATTISQQMIIWDWQNNTKLDEAPIRVPQCHHFVTFHPDGHELMSHGDQAQAVRFWTLKDGKLEIHAAKKGYMDMSKDTCGKLTQSVFDANSNIVLSASNRGNILLWDYIEKNKRRSLIKVVRLSPRGAINTLYAGESFIACGCGTGTIRFFTYGLMLINIVRTEIAQEITSVSLFNMPKIKPEWKSKDFEVPPMSVSTMSGQIFIVTPKLDNPLKPHVEPVMNTINYRVVAMACHPSHPTIVYSTNKGWIMNWDYEDRKHTTKREMNSIATCFEFNSTGTILLVGYQNGVVRLLISKTLRDIQMLKPDQNRPGPITKLKFASKIEMFATASEKTVALYSYLPENSPNVDIKPGEEWGLIGRHEAHTGQITDLYWSCEAPTEAENQGVADTNKRPPRLFSISTDRVCQEYDIENSNDHSGLLLSNSTKLEESAIPTTICYLPKMTCLQRESKMQLYREEDLLISTSDDLKFKVWAAKRRAHVTMTRSSLQIVQIDEEEKKDAFENAMPYRRTSLAPMEGGVIRSIKRIRNNAVLQRRINMEQSDHNEVLLYSTDSTIGIWPVRNILEDVDEDFWEEQLRANIGEPTPSQSCVVAHCEGIQCIDVNCQGRVVTVGRVDGMVQLWSIGVGATLHDSETTAKEKKPRTGKECTEFTQLMRDYFYYVQIRSDGLKKRSLKKVEGKITVRDGVDIMRALGYFPTESEVENMEAEIAFKRMKAAGDDKQESDLIDFQELVSLYINYRNVYGITREELEQSFKNIPSIKHKQVSLKDFAKHLRSKGDRMRLDEIYECLALFTGKSKENLPKTITPAIFDQEKSC